MAKIIKNTTANPVLVDDTGVSIPANGQYTIQTSEDSLWGSSDDLVTLVGNGTLVVNDGTVDLSISDGIDLIKGLFPKTIDINGITAINGELPVNATVNVSASAQTISSKIRSDFSNVKQDLPKSTQTILDYYTYTGSGTFYGFTTYFNSSSVQVELEIDGETVFSIILSDFDDFKEEDELIPWFKLKDKQLSFNPSFGIKFSSSVKLKAKASTNSSSKDMKVYLVNIEKVT